MEKKPNIIKFIDEQASEELHLILRGHLYLEFLLNEIFNKIFPNSEELKPIRMTFYVKVKILRASNRFDQNLSDLLLKINSLRNSYTHKLHYKIDFDSAFELANIAAKAHIDFSDETIFENYGKSKEWYGIYGILNEVISNTFQHIVWACEDIFSQDEISDFLG